MTRDYRFRIIGPSLALVLVACGEQQAPVEPAAPPAREESRLLDQAADAVKAASDQLGEAASSTSEAVSQAADSAMARAESMTSGAIEQAKEMIAQVKDYLARGETDLARKLMDRLIALKESLPEGLQAEIDRLEAMFTAQ